MSDAPTSDSIPTIEPLALADQQPVAAAPRPAADGRPSGSSTRTILEVVGGVVAVGLIVMAGIVGFAVGHFTSEGDRQGHFFNDRAMAQGGPNAGPGTGSDPRDGFGPGPGPGMMPGQGFDPRGTDPDGDNWTGGQGRGMMPGQGAPSGPGTLPTTPQP